LSYQNIFQDTKDLTSLYNLESLFTTFFNASYLNQLKGLVWFLTKKFLLLNIYLYLFILFFAWEFFQKFIHQLCLFVFAFCIVSFFFFCYLMCDLASHGLQFPGSWRWYWRSFCLWSKSLKYAYKYYYEVII